MLVKKILQELNLKNKLSKRLLPIEIIDGKLSEDETIYYNDIEIGKSFNQ